MAPRTYISLFAGCGGLDLAVRLALPGSRCALFVEREASAARILAARMADGSLEPAPIWSDVRAVDGLQLRDRIDGIVGGFPCTDLSVAGKRAGINGEHSGLWWEFARLICEIQPRWVFIENVPAVIHLGPGSAVLGELARLGFDAEWLTLRASNVGAPHRRQRVFILAHAALRGCGVRGESSGGAGQPDGDDGIVADASDGFVQEQGRQSKRRDGIGSAMPLFPPGPSDAAAWRDVLAERPWLAPAVESGIRVLVDGLAVVVDASRAAQLRAVGNGVVAIQGAAALRELWRRAGLK